MVTLLAFLVTIAFLILIHEGGHFLVARWAGVWVHRFAIGFGPALWRRQRGETEYSIRAFPIGGFVQLAGDEPGKEEDKPVPPERLFTAKPALTRMAIVTAGPAMNIAAAIALMVAVVAAVGVPYLEVIDFTENSSARGMLLPGDKILRVGGQDVYSIEQLNRLVQAAREQPLPVEVLRGAERRAYEITPRWNQEAGRYLLGITFSKFTPSTTTRLVRVELNSYLGEVGLRSGDVLLTADGQRLGSWLHFALSVQAALQHQAETMTLAVARGNEALQFKLLLSNKTYEQILRDVQPELLLRRPTFSQSFGIGVQRIWDTLVLFYNAIVGIFRGQMSAGEAFTGPVGIANILSESLSQSVAQFLVIVAILSLNLGIINLLPFPALDGSRLAFLTFELLRGKPVPPEREGLVHYIGFILLIGFLLFVTYKDIVRLFQ